MSVINQSESELSDILATIPYSTAANIYDKIHILIHADDANLIANSKNLMVSKITAMLDYCKVNSIVLQPSKCYFTVINGSADDKLLLQIPHHDPIEYQDHLEILGSHISGSLKTDLSLHFKKEPLSKPIIVLSMILNIVSHYLIGGTTKT